MQLGNSICFCLLGLGMILLPGLAPGFFPAEAGLGCNLSGVWLRFMGGICGLAGTGLGLHYILVVWLEEVRAWYAEAFAELHPAQLLCPALEIYA
jgi:hypothetical protein